MNRFQKWLPALFGLIVVLLVAVGVASWLRGPSSNINEPVMTETPTAAPLAAAPMASMSPSIAGSPSPLVSPLATPAVATAPAPGVINGKADLTVDANGMSKATIVMNTTQGTIKFKLYPQDAPHTVDRFVELAQKGFYNGLTFHRAIEGFIIQTGDPSGSGTGGSGQHLKAEFNNRRHLDGAVAMARAPSDPGSADSQFYITLSPQPRLDHNYTVFGQVIEGMDVARKIKVGDKITSLTIQ